MAKSLGLKPGDSLVSSPEPLFDLVGVFPLKMKVVAVLEKSYTSDDLSVFVGMKIALVIQGLGHGLLLELNRILLCDGCYLAGTTVCP